MTPSVQARLESFVDEHGRPPAVLHIGNVANNGYSNSKILNRAGIWADAMAYDYFHIMGCPEWEDGRLTGSIDLAGTVDWDSLDLGGFERPSWFVQGPMRLCIDYLRSCSIGDEDQAELVWRRLAAARRDIVYPAAAPTPAAYMHHHRFDPAIARRWQGHEIDDSAGVPFEDRVAQLVSDFHEAFPERPNPLTAPDFEPYRTIYTDLVALCSRYDLIQGNSTDPVLAMIAGVRPYVAYEHGTLRDIPFEPSAIGKMTALAYFKAEAVIITNPDCKEFAERLGVTNAVFIPHVIDSKYYEDDVGTDVPFDADQFVFCPARQHWDDKRNDIAIRGFAAIADDFPELQILLPSWGPDVDRATSLITDLGIIDRAVFTAPLTIRQLISTTRRASALIDQFKFAVFGAIGPTALASGTPLVTRLDHSLSAWCMTKPPYFHAEDVASCAASLRAALTVDTDRHAQEQFDWMRTNYWYGDVAQRHVELYLDVLDRTPGENPAPHPAISPAG